ncbi:Ig-like domain-containing protein [Bacillus velezensis]|uniref:Ig-like domain-containing protein n=1 Tax=Bacillus velezensis TaxID=492670 RepID=UPI00399D61A5
MRKSKLRPNAPQGLTATPKDTSVSLSWDAVTFNGGIKEYEVYRDGVSIGSRVGTAFADSGLTQLTTYKYQVRAIPNTGDPSPLSAELSVTTLATEPTGVNVTETAKTLTVGDTYKINATVTPSSADQSVTFTSSSTATATVSSSGLVTAKAAGTTTITVASKSKPSVKKTVAITVNEPAPPAGE